jgi:hypothetical protein
LCDTFWDWLKDSRNFYGADLKNVNII